MAENLSFRSLTHGRRLGPVLTDDGFEWMTWVLEYGGQISARDNGIYFTGIIGKGVISYRIKEDSRDEFRQKWAIFRCAK